MRKSLIAIAAATALVSTAALASVTLTISGGALSGFIGKGDVQSAFGFNNGKMQDAAPNVVFNYSDTQSADVTCEWTTGPDRNPTTHTVTHTRNSSLSATWFGNARQSPNQTTGWNVNGVLLNGSGQPIPNVGDPCPGNNGNGSVVTAVVDLGSTGAILTASVNGVTRQFPITTLTVN
jgi:hypothetical protein